jgi:ribosomal protein S18 acetylase RimI-like enzyme
VKVRMNRNALLSFVEAKPEDASVIADLVNSAYRGDSSRVGWTTEADLLEGKRTDAEEIRALIGAPGSMFLMCVEGADVVGSVFLRKGETAAYLGMLVVSPRLQGAGIGSRLMAAAEEAAKKAWGVSTMSMAVISCRHELIAFYERRGYRRTGERKPLPHGILSVPRVENLELETFEKALGRSPQ